MFVYVKDLLSCLNALHSDQLIIAGNRKKGTLVHLCSLGISRSRPTSSSHSTKMRLARSLLVLLLMQIQFGFELIYGQDETDDDELRYMVGLSEPLGSTLEWDYDDDEQTSLLLRWNITLTPGSSGLLAFSNYDLNTDRLDVIIFGNDGKVYNGYTNETSFLSLPKNSPKLKYTLINTENVPGEKRKKFTVEIVRPLNICDEEKRSYIIDRGTIHLLTGALSREDFQTIKQKKMVKMDEKRMDLTLQRVQLLKSQVSFTPVADSEDHLDYLNQDVLIPDVETTYWCTRFELPPSIMKKPHHIIRFDGLISPKSEGVVHHMELFHCDVSTETVIPSFNQACTSEQKPMGLTPCRRVIGAWALGATNFTYPEEAGGSIGGPGKSRFLVLEVHFNNPYLKSGIIDRSGIRLFYTSNLRKYDAGIMEIGLEYNAKNSMPPKADAFRVSGYCAGECTQVALPPKGIIVFASQLHTHLTGIEVFTRILKRNGRVETLNVDRHYSPHFQEIRLLPKPVRIEPGDAIIHTCIYNTESRTNMTFGGYGIRDEMCVNYIHYYPRSQLELCKTSVEDKELDRFFRTMKEYDDAPISREKSIEENYQSIRWTPLTTEILQTFYELAPIHLSCNGSDGNYSPKFDWQREYRPQEPEQRDVPLDAASANCQRL